MTPLVIHIKDIKIGNRQRETDEEHAVQLSESIKLHGLLQPIILDEEGTLIAGGHRLRALQILGMENLIQGVHFLHRGALTEDERAELELEENVKRKDLTWQERCSAIAKIHALKCKQSALSFTEWGQSHTGDLLGVAQANVSYALQISKAIEKGDEQIKVCATLTDALKVFSARKEKEAMQRLVTFVNNQKEECASIPDINLDEESTQLIVSEVSPTPSKVPDCVTLTDAFDWMMSHPACADHIITDPPYGQDLINLYQRNKYENTTLQELEQTHEPEQVKGNTLPMVRGFYNCLKDNGYALVWCDPEFWMALCTAAQSVGFSIQRWPLVWCKTHTCLNNSAFCNFTKAVEFVAVLRKGSPTLVRPQGKNFFMAGNCGKARMDHLFVKPYAVWEWLYNSVAISGQTVLDPFSGVGSSTLAALQLGLKPIALEINEEFYNRQLEHIRNEYTKLSTVEG